MEDDHDKGWNLYDSVTSHPSHGKFGPVKRVICGTEEIAARARDVFGPGVLIEVDARLGSWGWTAETEKP